MLPRLQLLLCQANSRIPGVLCGVGFRDQGHGQRGRPRAVQRFPSRKNWVPEPIALSGVTDCYQPAERHYKLTRRCLEVAVEFQQPMLIVTKNVLVLRDIDLLRELALNNLVHVNLSITTLDGELVRSMEPRTSIPEARLRAIRGLADAGVPVSVLMAPVIPGLNDSEIPNVLAASKDAGATGAGYILLRLPLTVTPVFWEWLERAYPNRLLRVQTRIQAVRDGKFNDSRFGARMSGTGEISRRIADLFCLFRKRYGLDAGLPPLDCSRFRRPQPKTGQLYLF